MENFKFTYNNKEYELNESNCEDFLNDEDFPVTGIQISDILQLLNKHDEVNFDIEYYGQPCQQCLWGKEEKLKHYKFLEHHFFIFTKNGEYVIANISEEYKNTTFSKLLKQGKIDNSFIVSIIVCIECSSYSIEIEQCDM